MTTPQPAALPDLTAVIAWLENGCDPSEAVKELKHYQSKLRALAALQSQPAAAGVSDAEISRLWSWSATAEAERTATTQQHAFAYALLALRPQAVPMTDEQRALIIGRAADKTVDRSAAALYAICETERLYGITAQGAQGGEG